MKFIYLLIFIISFIIGLIAIYITPMEYKTVIVYPTPSNTNDLQYENEIGECFKYKATLVDCTTSTINIPKTI